jgi:pimeloyl-ACP methyl ester carboxylesterase
MPYATAADGVKLYYEEAGSGTPIVFVHEFGDNYRSWEQQVGFFSRRYRCIVYAARGYPPSDIPADVERYSQRQACDDIAAVMDHLGLVKAHIVGISMGGFATLHFGLNHASRALSLTAAAAGYGAEKAFEGDSKKFAAKAHQQMVSTGQLVQKGCPFSGGPVKEGTQVSIGDAEVGFCCNNCKGKVEKASDDEKVTLVFGSIEKGFEPAGK